MVSGSKDVKSPSIDEPVQRVLPVFAKLEQRASLAKQNNWDAIKNRLNFSDGSVFPLKFRNQKKAKLTYLNQFVSHGRSCGRK